jgi:methylated-DNA-protein-cysteine methyltransferase-like protein
MQEFTQKVIFLIKSVPEGKVCTYGTIALMAGHPKGARQVSRIIHSMARKHNLPWHRIINAKGQISLPVSQGYEAQKALLESEGIFFGLKDRVDLKAYLWTGSD